MPRKLPVLFQIEPGALKAGAQAAAYLGIGRTKFWQLVNLPEKDPMRIKLTPYGTVSIVELNRHLAVATAMAA